MRAIVEERDATDEQRAIREINAGVYIGDAAAIRGALGRIDADNDQGEQYFTDVLGLLVDEGAPVGGGTSPRTPTTSSAATTSASWRRGGGMLNDRVLDDLMRSRGHRRRPADHLGRRHRAPSGPTPSCEPGTQLRGTTSVAAGAVVGPDSTLVDTEVGEGARRRPVALPRAR